MGRTALYRLGLELGWSSAQWPVIGWSSPGARLESPGARLELGKGCSAGARLELGA